MRTSFVRERRVDAGGMKAVSLYTRTFEQERRCKEPRGRKKGISKISQKNWNEKRKKQNATFLIFTNFHQGDYYLTVTYNNQFLPEDLERAEKDKRNLIDKWKRLYTKAGVELKFMWFTSYQMDGEGKYIKRIHYHVLLNKLPKGCGFDRDDVEECWSEGRGKKAKSKGTVECKRIQGGMEGLRKIAVYLTSQEKWVNRQWKKGQKRWSSSKNLKKPTETTNDSWWSQRKLVKEIVKSNDSGEDIFSKRFPGYKILGEPRIRETEESGWHIYVEMLKIEP